MKRQNKCTDKWQYNWKQKISTCNFNGENVANQKQFGEFPKLKEHGIRFVSVKIGVNAPSHSKIMLLSTG